ncbi:MAG: CDP-diacylglycerol--serine O-phosphatidyltransferase [Acidobacteriota bacterium]
MQERLFQEGKTPRSKRREKLRRGIYLLPSLFTITNLFLGFYSIILSMNGEFEISAIMVFLAGVLDFLDGRVARMMRSTSEFGVEFDSLADLVSCGLAPAFLIYLWGLAPLGRIGWLVAFLYVIGSAMRLARFNIQRFAEHRRYFIGIPVPAAAYLTASCVYLFADPVKSRTPALFLSAYIMLITVLMISRIKYRSFKDIDLRSRKSYIYIFFIAFIFVAIAVEPKYAIFAFSVAYLASGVIPVAFAYLRKACSVLIERNIASSAREKNGDYAEKEV